MISTFLPRKSESRTSSPARFGSSKSGAMADRRKLDRAIGISPKLHTRWSWSTTYACSSFRARAVTLNHARLSCTRHEHLTVPILEDRDAQLVEARALRLQLEAVDSREVVRDHPQIVRVRARRCSTMDRTPSSGRWSRSSSHTRWAVASAILMRRPCGSSFAT